MKHKELPFLATLLCELRKLPKGERFDALQRAESWAFAMWCKAPFDPVLTARYNRYSGASTALVLYPEH